MSRSLSVTFHQTDMVKIENDIEISSKLIFYRRFLDEIYISGKIGKNIFFNQLNNYHPNIKVTIKLNPSKYLCNKFTNFDGFNKFKLCKKSTKLQST